jgi:ribosome-associated protein
VTSDEGKPSKTQRKKAVHALQDLGESLVELSEEQLAGIELPERLRAAVVEAQRITRFEARRRQLQYIGKLMRSVDSEPIRAALAALRARPRG